MNLKNAFNIVHIKECESTQDEAIRLALEKKSNALVVSDIQNKGRGRRGREWLSNAEDSLTMTLAIQEKDVGDFSAMLSLYAGAVLYVSLCEYSEKFSKLTLKWPNDLGLYHAQQFRKLAGILVELKKGYFLVGIGINTQGKAPLEEAMSLTDVDSQKITKLNLARKFAENFIKGISDTSTKNLVEFLSNKAMRDLWGRSLGSKWEHHIAKGLAGDGALLCQTPTGKFQIIYSGDI